MCMINLLIFQKERKMYFLNWFIKRYHWKGILVEPVPAYFDQLKNTYRNSKDLIFENIAISTKTQSRAFYYLLDKDNSLPPWAKGVGSFSLKHVLALKNQIRDFDKHLVSTKITCLSLKSLLEKYGINHVDVFVIDAEGYDYDIIKQINFDTIRPEIIVFESMLLGSRDRADCYNLLSANGYELFDNECDTVAVLKRRE